MSKLRLAGVTQDSIVDGPGLRMTVFTQGCSHHCPGCHNPQTHDPAGGTDAETQDLIRQMRANPLLDGITLSGGEPFEQPGPCAELAAAAHAAGLSVWAYTGYTLEQLLQDGNAERLQLLGQCDVLVDGPFVLAQRSLQLRFRGSRNQRLVDVKASLAAGTAVLWEDEYNR